MDTMKVPDNFNNDFPENNNIQYENKTHALIKVKDDLVLKDLNLLAEELVKEKTDKVHKFAENNKEQICTTIELEKYNEHESYKVRREIIG